MKYRELLKELADDGWVQIRQTGGHRQLRHPTKPGAVTVAGRPGEDVPKSTLASIVKQAGLERKRR